MMLVIVVEFQIKPAFIEAFGHAIIENARASREDEPGCRQFDVCRDPTDATMFFLYELYVDAAAFDAHLASLHFSLMSEATAAWVERKTVRRYQRLAP